MLINVLTKVNSRAYLCELSDYGGEFMMHLHEFNLLPFSHYLTFEY